MPRVDAGGISIGYREWGENRTEPPIVLLHSAGTGSILWADVGEMLGRARWTLALDLPGHGESAAMPEAISIEAYSDRVGQFLRALEIDEAVLCGHSMGGAIALDRAVTTPNQVAALVLCASGARLTMGTQLLALVREQFSALPKLLESVAYSPLTPAELVGRWCQTVLQAPQEIVLGDFLACEQFDAREKLGTLRIPTLILVGQDDLLTPPKYSTYLAGQIEGARLLVMDQAGHHLMHEKSDEFVQAILGFLERRPKN